MAMGFEYDVTNVPTDEERIATALREIGDGLKHVRGDPVWSRERTAPGMLMLLEDCVNSEYWGIALSIAFTLGRASIVGKVDPAAAARAIAEKEAQCRAGADRAEEIRDEADTRWRREGEKIWRERYANLAPDDPDRITVEDLAVLIQDDVAAGIKLETIQKQIGKWNKRDGIKRNAKRRPRR
jgi:hypothetical protein